MCFFWPTTKEMRICVFCFNTVKWVFGAFFGIFCRLRKQSKARKKWDKLTTKTKVKQIAWKKTVDLFPYFSNWFGLCCYCVEAVDTLASACECKKCKYSRWWIVVIRCSILSQIEAKLRRIFEFFCESCDVDAWRIKLVLIEFQFTLKRRVKFKNS